MNTSIDSMAAKRKTMKATAPAPAMQKAMKKASTKGHESNSEEVKTPKSFEFSS